MAAAPTHATNIADIAEREEAERHARYQRAWLAYDGEAPKALEVGPNEADDNIRFDYAKLIVDKGVSFLVGKGQGVTLQPAPPNEAEAVENDEAEPDEVEADEESEQEAVEAAQAKLDEAWPPHKRQIDLHNLATNGGICGHVWIRLAEDGSVSILDPETCTAVWNEDDVTILERYLLEWSTVDNETGLGTLRRKRIEPDNPKSPNSWTIFDEEHDDDASAWIVIDETLWAHPFAPVVDGQNLPSPNTYYGEADLEPAILDMVEQLESIASDMRRILRLHGHPVPVIFGEEANRLQAMDVSLGQLLAIPNPEGSLGQLAIAELKSGIELFNETKTALFEAAHIPKIALGDTGNAGPTSGVALQVEYAPLTERTDTKRTTYGYTLIETAERILALKGLKGWTVTLAWPELLPSDPVSDANADESELRMGIVSKQTISEKHGYDWGVEEQRIAEETPNFDPGTWSYVGNGIPGAPATSPPSGPAE